MATPDPRQGGDDEALAIRHEPPAPEPKQGKPAPHFNRERFLLRLVAWILMVQFAVWGAVGLSCAFLLLYKQAVMKVSEPTCDKAGAGFQKAVDGSLSILLALLGGGALAVDEMKRRKENDPREGDRLPPPR
jgi:hypothetical protein